MITKALSFVLPLSFLSAVSALRPASLTGQAPASVKPGSAIRITLKSSRRFEATFVGLSQDSLQWRLGYGPAALHGAVPRDSIALWEIRRGGAGPLGAVIGLIAGAGLGAVAASHEQSDRSCSGSLNPFCLSLPKSAKQALDIGLSATLGAIVGAVVGSHVRKTTWQPQSLSAASPSVKLLDEGRMGLGLTWNF